MASNMANTQPSFTCSKAIIETPEKYENPANNLTTKTPEY